MSDTRAAPLVEGTAVGFDWTPVVAGAFAAAALGFVLHSFAIAVGLSVSSTAPTWRDASFALVLLSGLYILLVALASYGFGGYVAARLRARRPARRSRTSSSATACMGSWCGRSRRC